MRTPRKKTISVLCFLSLTLLFGCEKYYLSLTEQDINVNYLASIAAATPDKRQQNPPLGEMIVMDWRIPKELLGKNPVIELHVIYGNYTEKSFEYPIRKKMGYVTYKDLNDEFALTKGIITYSADIRLDDGTFYKSWKHQLWANLIRLHEDSETSAAVPLIEEDGPYSDEPTEEPDESEDKDVQDPQSTSWAVPLVEEDGPYSDDFEKAEESQDEDTEETEETAWAVPLVEEDGPYSEESQDKEETPTSDGSSSTSEETCE